MRFYRIALLIILTIVTAGCGSGSGTDSPDGSPPGTGGATISSCTRCHSSSVSPSLDPLVTNGSGTFGKHIRHVLQRGIGCERCHSGYFYSATHMNGVFDTGSRSAALVKMDIIGPQGSWDATAGSCSEVACHGDAVLDWYGTNSWTTPACATCHVLSYAPELDPIVTGGTGTFGKHQKHVQSYGYTCGRCHESYPARSSHANGILDSRDPATAIVWFDATNPTGTWGNDSGPETGTCSLVACHGAYSGTFTYESIGGDGSTVTNTVPYAGNGGAAVSWYAVTGLGCGDCHGNPPAIPNSSQTYVWHSGHHANQDPTGAYNQCQLCHPDAVGLNGLGTAITDTILHVNGSINVQAQFSPQNCGCHF